MLIIVGNTTDVIKSINSEDNRLSQHFRLPNSSSKTDKSMQFNDGRKKSFLEYTKLQPSSFHTVCFYNESFYELQLGIYVYNKLPDYHLA